MTVSSALFAFALVLLLLTLFFPAYPCIVGAIICCVAAMLLLDL